MLSFCEMQLLFQTDPSANWDTEFMCHVPCGLYKDIHNPVILCCELCTCYWYYLVAPTLDHTQSAWITPTFCSNVQRYDFYYHGLQYTITTGLHDMQLGFNWMQLGCRCNTVHVYWSNFQFFKNMHNYYTLYNYNIILCAVSCTTGTQGDVLPVNHTDFHRSRLRCNVFLIH